MKRLAPLIAFLVISAHAGSLCAQDAGDRDALIRKIINRSRLLEDVHFRLPRSVWRRFVLDSAKDDDPAPIPCIPSRGEYRLTISGDGQAALETEIHLHVLDHRSGAIAVLPNSLAWSKITLAVGDGKPAGFKPATKGKWLVMQASKPGLHIIRASASLKGYEASGGTLILPIIRTVQTAAALKSPLAFEVSAQGAANTGVGQIAKGTSVVLPLKPSTKLVLRYNPLRRISDRSASYQINGSVAWNFGPAAQQVSADLRVAILGGKSEGLQISLPQAAKRVSVSGPDVREIRIQRGEVSVFFRGAISGRTRLKLSYELPGAKAASSLGRPEIRNGRWSGGTLVITNTAGGSEIQPAKMSGLKEIALGDIPKAASAILAGKAVLAYSITAAQWSAQADSMNLGEFAIKQTIADTARYQFAYRPDGSVICRADYEIRNRNRQFLKVILPPNAKVLLARVSEKSRPMTLRDAKKGEYLLPLERSTASVMGLVSFPVQIVYIYRTGALKPSGTTAVALPRIDAPVAYAWCQARVPRRMKGMKVSGVMRPVEQYSSQTAQASMTYGSATAVDPQRKRLGLPQAVKKPPPKKSGGLFGGWARVFSGKQESPSQSITAVETTVTAPEGKTRVLSGSSLSSGSLARNYWRAGKESYDKGKYDDADKALNKVLEMAPNSTDAPNAKRLLANIKLLKGKLQVKSRSEKAAAVEVKQQISASNAAELEKQTKLVEGGQKAAQQGDVKRAKKMFQAAEALSERLIAKGESQVDQTSRLRVAKEQLEISRKSTNEQFEKDLDKLKKLRKSGQINEAGLLAEKLAIDAEELSQPATFSIPGNTGAMLEFQKEREQLAIDSAKLTLKRNRQAKPTKPTSTVGGYVLEDRSKQSVQIHQIGDLVAGLSDADGKDDLKYIDAQEDARGKRTAELSRQVKSLLTGGTVQITTHNGQRAFKVQAGADEQAAVSKLIQGLRQARGPQVELGKNLALQEGMNNQPANDTPDYSRRELADIYAARDLTSETTADPELQKFINKNYAWRNKKNRPDGSNSMLLADALEERKRRDQTRRDTPNSSTTSLDIRRSEIPWHRQVDYPKNWKEITAKQKQIDDQANRVVNKQLDTRVSKLDFEDMKLSQAFQFLRDVSGAGLHVKWRALALEGVEPSTTVNVNLSNATFREGLKTVLKSAGGGKAKLEYALSQGVITISTKADFDAQPIVRVYNIRDMVVDVPMFEGPRLGRSTGGHSSFDSGSDLDGDLKKRSEIIRGIKSGITSSIDRDSWRDAGGETGAISEIGGQLVITQTRENHAKTAALLEKLRKAESVKAKGAVTTSELTGKLRFNRGQKAQVASRNINADVAAANALGLKFRKGNNDISYTVIDEAQFRTLMEIDSANNARPAGGEQVDPNETRQDTIIGTDALLANGMTTNVIFGRDKGNTLDIGDNQINLSHEKYVLVDNGGYLTAVRTGEMQNWRAAAKHIEFVKTPQEIEIPNVGELVKLEKTLVKPGDEMIVRFDYQWKGR